MFRQISSSFRFEMLSRIISLLWMGTLVAASISNPMLSYPGRDSGIFLYIGSLILKGKMPYLDVWENKGPLIFYINALGLFVSNGSRWGVWFLELLFLLGAAWTGYLVIKQRMGVTPALLAIYIWLSALGNVLQGGNFSEEYALLFSLIAVFAFLKSLEQPGNRSFLLLIGISLALNFLLRPNNVSQQVAALTAYFVLTILSRNWRLLFKRIAFVVLGSLIIIIPVVVYFYMRGALIEMINVVFVFNYQYSEGNDMAGLLSRLANASASIGWIFVILGVAGYILSLVSLLKRGELETMTGSFLLLNVIGWPIEAFLSTLSERNYPHYFMGWTPYIGFLCAYIIHVLMQNSSRRLGKYAVTALLALWIIGITSRIDLWRDYGTVISGLFLPEARLEYVDPVASYIRENTLPADKVLVWGFRPMINFVSERESPVSFLPYPFVHVRTGLTNHWADQFYRQFTSDPPVLIVNMIDDSLRGLIPDLDLNVRKQEKIKYKDVVLAPNLRDILSFIDKNYVLVETVDRHNIYRLKSSSP
jgi:hypothetical protein